MLCGLGREQPLDVVRREHALLAHEGALEPAVLDESYDLDDLVLLDGQLVLVDRYVAVEDARAESG